VTARLALSLREGLSGYPALTVRLRTALALTLFTQIVGAAFSEAQSGKVIGIWTVEIAFENGESRSLRIEAREAGTASFLLLDPQLKVWGPAKPSEAKWTQSNDGSVMFSGPLEFPLGNVGRDPGTLVLKGKFGTADLIIGEAKFSRTDQERAQPEPKPSKNGSFKATRAAG
jgi:hypothetical protein